jgi:hypothetical protein
MDYELAKQLKDAGFPQNTDYAIAKSPWDKKGDYLPQRMTKLEGNNGYANLLSAGYDVIATPTLEELISACGNEFDRLEQDFDTDTNETYWSALAHRLNKACNGSTPTEAVARLWLSLNAKAV